jgi:hypothetical protein
MFSLNLNGIFVLTMFKKSYFLKWGSPRQTAFMAVPLTSTTNLSTLTFVICHLLVVVFLYFPFFFFFKYFNDHDINEFFTYS